MAVFSTSVGDAVSFNTARTGHFCNLETRTGPFGTLLDFKDRRKDFDAEKYGDFKAAIDAVNEANVLADALCDG